MTPKIITIDAIRLFENYVKQLDKKKQTYCLNTNNRYFYNKVVKHTEMFDECPLLHQIVFCKKFEEEKIDINEDDEWLLDKLIIVDFGNIFDFTLTTNEYTMNRKKILQKNASDLIENGLDLQLKDRCVHMIPFDKSGNMSRNSRITFIDNEYCKEINERLNLGINFSEIEVVLSKYYAYRGLYLSSSQRVPDIEITPETLVVIKDHRIKKNGKKEREILGPAFERNVPIITAKEGEIDVETHTQQWEFDVRGIEEELIYAETPFDGEGFISSGYSEIINESLELSEASSYQIRLPFVKGMLHKVDVHGFLKEFDPDGMNEEKYEYEDAFGIVRDLNKAHIFISESMFKGQKWLKEYCDNKKISDPMQYYCDMIKKYGHALYISSTDIPYGNSMYTHLSYQMINTIDFNDKQFNNVAYGHKGFIKEPIRYIRKDNIYNRSSWQEAVLYDKAFENDIYIKSELKNTKKSLLTKLVEGKLVVKGQTRYLCRDLLPLLANLFRSEDKVEEFYYKCLWMKYYMPMKPEFEKPKFEKFMPGYTEYAAFFRSPHLSRNEQCVLQPLVLPKGEDEFIPYGKRSDGTYEVDYTNYMNNIALYKKYFGHLTGVVMVPRGSIVPLCLGGADFDGDLINIVFDKNVVDAVRSSCYEGWMKRKLPVIRIPSMNAKSENVPKVVKFEHIRDTFSNRIGYLSNSAISIGQIEYGNDRSEQEGQEKLTCSICTILTGLEIDAAKNGIHPDLSLIEESNIPKSSYIIFLNKFKRLKANPNFVFDNIKVSEESGCIEVEANGCKEHPKFSASKENIGTKINKLPILFMEEVKHYNDNNSSGNHKTFNPFAIDYSNDKKAAKIKKFKTECKDIFQLYFYYRKIFLKILKDEINKSSHGAENISKLILKKYDEENASTILDEIVPGLINKIDTILPENWSVSDVKKRINDECWQFQPDEKKGETLAKILGNDFQENILSEDEKELLYHFNQQGYKMLWYLISAIDDYRIQPYAKMKEKIDKIKVNKEINNKQKMLQTEYDKVLEEFYVDNYKDVDNKLYEISLERIQNLIENTNIDISYKVSTLYEVTQNDSNHRKIFWDIFSWKTIRPLIDKEG